MINKYFLSYLILLILISQNLLAKNHFLTNLQEGVKISGFQLIHLYTDSENEVLGSKWNHSESNTPIYLLSQETTPQVLVWVNTPDLSNKGLPHALEHLLAGKGLTGRYRNLLKQLTFGQDQAATFNDYVFYGLSSAEKLIDFNLQFRALLEALFQPDFTDLEAEREFYHWGLEANVKNGGKKLIEKGTVYIEMQNNENNWDYYYGLRKKILGAKNPLSYQSGGSPSEMRVVTPKEIKQFHQSHYLLGPTTGFIFVISPKDNIKKFLAHIASEFSRIFSMQSINLKKESKIGNNAHENVNLNSNELDNEYSKYPIEPSTSNEIEYFDFPAASDSHPGTLLLGWQSQFTQSQLEIQLLDLLITGLGSGKQALIYKDLVDSQTKKIALNIMNTFAAVSRDHSSFFPYPYISLGGIASNQLSKNNVKVILEIVNKRIKEIFSWIDGQSELKLFNENSISKINALARSSKVWTRNSPSFGTNKSAYLWKEFFEFLDMNTKFIQSLTFAEINTQLYDHLKSQTNIWKALISKYHLLENPFVTVGRGTIKKTEQLENEKNERVLMQMDILKKKYSNKNDQEVLVQFENEENVKSTSIDKISSQVTIPSIAPTYPLVPDSNIQFRVDKINSVPTSITFFDKPPTKDFHLIFDLHWIPEDKIKYIPILASFITNVGIKVDQNIQSYSDVEKEINDICVNLQMRYRSNIENDIEELVIDSSTLDIVEFNKVLNLISRFIYHNYLEQSNLKRLKDIVKQLIINDKNILKNNSALLVSEMDSLLRYGDSPLAMVVNSSLTKAHWHHRIWWQLHDPVDSKDLNDVIEFGHFQLEFLKTKKLTAKDIENYLRQIKEKGLNQELIDYWLELLNFSPPAEIILVFEKLLIEVVEDLKHGPAKTIAEIQETQNLLLHKSAINIELSISHRDYRDVRTSLIKFLNLFPNRQTNIKPFSIKKNIQVLDQIRTRYALNKLNWPRYFYFENIESRLANVQFSAQSLGFSQLKQDDFAKMLGSHIYSGGGPQTLFMKTWEAGLAYNNGINSSVSNHLIVYTADRISSISSLLKFVDSIAERKLSDKDFQDHDILKYVFAQYFDFSRTMLSVSQRSSAFLWDFHNNITNEMYLEYSRKLLRFKKQSNIQQLIIKNSDSELKKILISSDEQIKRKAQSQFVFSSSDIHYKDIETFLPSSIQIWKIWPSDFW